MRELKFRAWCNGQKRMFTKVMIGNLSNPDSEDYTANCIYRDGEWYHSDEHDDVVWMQYTGLKDKDGVEIFEGDIVSDHVGVGEVKYSEKKAAYKVSYTDGIYAKWFIDYMNSAEVRSIEVIGNIYENPELLK